MNRRAFFGAILAVAGAPLCATPATSQEPPISIPPPPGGVLIRSDVTTTTDQSRRLYTVTRSATWRYRHSLCD